SDQRKNALTTSFSAAERFTGRVFVRMLFQVSRILLSRSRSRSPCASDFFSEVIFWLRSLKAVVSGVIRSRSPRNSAMAATATMARTCRRLFMFTRTSFDPAEIEVKLERTLAVNLVHLHVSDFLRPPQL